MENKNDLLYNILLKTTHLPKHLLDHYQRNNVAEFILHSLGHKDCFHLAKAAYFIDNPDFDTLQGVVGYEHVSAYQDDHWKNPDLFTAYMQSTGFNTKVRSMIAPSVQRNKKEYKDIVNELAFTLEIERPQFMTWPTKHENYGFFLYEPAHQDYETIKEHLEYGLYLLGFCPVF